MESKFFQSLLGLPGKVTLHSVLSLALTTLLLLIFRLAEAGNYEFWDLVALFLILFFCWIVYVVGEKLIKKYLNIEIDTSMTLLKEKVS